MSIITKKPKVVVVAKSGSWKRSGYLYNKV